MTIKYIFYALLLCVSMAYGNERILQFFSDIQVHTDASLSVTETIVVRAEGVQIKRGIVREIPTRFNDRWGNHFVVDLTVTAVGRDGKKENYHSEDAVNGIRIFTGAHDVFLKPGVYTYTISYNTNRWLGFFNGRDELYWNVNGNGSRFPIDQVGARVTLPKGIAPADIIAEAYTGSFGEQGKDYQINYDAEDRVTFTTTHAFEPGQGLTIVITWPQGFIVRPSFFMLWYYWIRDNLAAAWAWLGLFIMMLFYLIRSSQFRREQRLSTVIPLFEPPQGFSPGAVRYLHYLGYDATVLAADVVNMAVKGLLTIEYKKNVFGKEYILQKTAEEPQGFWADEYALLEQLFFKRDTTFKVSADNTSILADINAQLKKRYQTKYARYFVDSGYWGAIAIASSVFFIVPSFFAGIFSAVFACILLGIMLIFFLWYTRGYSAQGKRIKEQIEGFKLYLVTAETERMAIIGTPPTRTPELYEHYLPYAIALGCEKQWTRQFAPMFRAMEQQGVMYAPRWYHGGPHVIFVPETFASSFTHDLNSYAYSRSISSSGNTPGSSSGSSGRGSSGGGGGGGGVGGW